MSDAEDRTHARELIGRCDVVMAMQAALPEDIRAEPRITLVLTRSVGRGRTMRLLGRSGPKGEVLCENSDGHAVCSFHAGEVKKALQAVLAEASES